MHSIYSLVEVQTLATYYVPHMCNDNLAPDVQTLEFALQRRNHYPADKYCGKQSVIRWIEIYGIHSNIHCDPFNN